MSDWLVLKTRRVDLFQLWVVDSNQLERASVCNLVSDTAKVAELKNSNFRAAFHV